MSSERGGSFVPDSLLVYFMRAGILYHGFKWFGHEKPVQAAAVNAVKVVVLTVLCTLFFLPSGLDPMDQPSAGMSAALHRLKSVVEEMEKVADAIVRELAGAYLRASRPERELLLEYFEKDPETVMRTRFPCFC